MNQNNINENYDHSLLGENLKKQFTNPQADFKIFKIPNTFREVLEETKNKYIGLKGGRGSCKTFSTLAYGLEQSYNPIYKNSCFLVVREIQKSIEDSSHSVIKDLIEQADLLQDFKITNTKIINKITGVIFIFAGLRSTGGSTQFSQVNKLKGKHKVKLILGDESQDFTEESLNVLFPTVNRGGKIQLYKKTAQDLKSSISTSTRFIFCFNPNFKNDPILVKLRTFRDSKIIHINIFDVEPEFQDKQLLEQAAQEEKEIYYNHVWLGEESYKITGFPFAEVEEIRINNHFKTIAFLDPSFKGGDYTSLSFVGQSLGVLYTFGYCFKRSWFSCLDDIIELLAEYQPFEFWYEANGLGTAPQEIFAEHGIKAFYKDSIDNKHNRIYKTAGYVAHRTKLILNKSNQEYCKNLLEYTEESKNDDAPDSFSNACIVAGIIPNHKTIRT